MEPSVECPLEIKKGEIDMGHSGKKDKGKKENKKKAKHNLKEKRKIKHEKHENPERKHITIPGWTQIPWLKSGDFLFSKCLKITRA